MPQGCCRCLSCNNLSLPSLATVALHMHALRAWLTQEQPLSPDAPAKPAACPSTTKCHAAQAAQGKLAGGGGGLNWGRYHESCPDTGTVADTHTHSPPCNTRTTNQKIAPGSMHLRNHGAAMPHCLPRPIAYCRALRYSLIPLRSPRGQSRGVLLPRAAASHATHSICCAATAKC